MTNMRREMAGVARTNDTTDGGGRTIPSVPIPNRYDQLALLFAWVANSVAAGMSVTLTAVGKSLPLCSYPAYPRYRGGVPASASSYRCER